MPVIKASRIVSAELLANRGGLILKKKRSVRTGMNPDMKVGPPPHWLDPSLNRRKRAIAGTAGGVARGDLGVIRGEPATEEVGWGEGPTHDRGGGGRRRVRRNLPH